MLPLPANKDEYKSVAAADATPKQVLLVTFVLVGVWLDDGEGLLEREEDENLIFGVVFRVGTMQLIDGDVFDRKLRSPTAAGHQRRKLHAFSGRGNVSGTRGNCSTNCETDRKKTIRFALPTFATFITINLPKLNFGKSGLMKIIKTDVTKWHK